MQAIVLQCRYYSVNCNGLLERWLLAVEESADGDYIMVREKMDTDKRKENYHLTYDDAEFDLECTHEQWVARGAMLESAETFEFPRFEEEL